MSNAALAQVRRGFDSHLAPIHPGLLLRHVRCIDNTTGDRFQFHFSPEQLVKWASTPNGVTNKSIPVETARKVLLPASFEDPYEKSGWEWQGDLIDWWIGSDVTLILKARQLGITWCAAGVALWYLLCVPGSRVLVQSKNEDDAADLVDHIWEMYLSLGVREEDDGTVTDLTHLRNNVKVMKPARAGARPHLDIEFQHQVGRDTKISQLNAMASTAGAGHGRTASFVILDEFSRHPYAREAYKAVVPAQGGSKKARGKTAIISTANGISLDYDSGNFYHHLWTSAEDYRIRTEFLAWDRNPDRDEDWYENVALKLPPKDRGEQYPRTPREAFILTGDRYFDHEALLWYEDHIATPLYRGSFEITDDPKKARFRKSEFGHIAVYEEPIEGHRYAGGFDCATGRGKDFSAGYLIDLDTGKLVAEIHCKIDAPAYAEQIHFLGHWYNAAIVAPELGGGYGDAVIHPLRDGAKGRPPYPRIYRHRDETNVKRPGADRFGFPMTLRTRPQVIAQLEVWLRTREFDELPQSVLDECNTFVHRDSGTSPAAQDGCFDDRVMALCLTLEMFRRFGARVSWREEKQKDPEKELTRRRDGTLDPKVLAKRYPAY